MSNGKIDDAEVDAILSGGREKVDRFLIVSVLEIREAIEDVAHSRRYLYGLLSAACICVGLATPYVLHLV